MQSLDCPPPPLVRIRWNGKDPKIQRALAVKALHEGCVLLFDASLGVSGPRLLIIACMLGTLDSLEPE